MSKESIHIKVLLFGSCREAVGINELDCVLKSPATAADAWKELKRQFAELERFERSALVAINEEHAHRNHPLNDGDTLAIFPPVSGG